MPKPVWKPFFAFAAATVAGAALHAAYGLFPSILTAVFSPVNESIWEHLKLLFWPYLAAVLLLKPDKESGGRLPWLLTLLLICGLMLAAGYLYYIVFFGTNKWFGPVLYVLLMAAGFVLPGRLRGGSGARWRDAAGLAVAALGAAIILFTFLPPDHVLFTDLSGVNTWEVIPW